MNATALWWNGRAWLVAALLFALAHRGYAQALGANGASLQSDSIASVASVGKNTPFATAIVDPKPGLKLPEQGPWILTEGDLLQPLGITKDLVKHQDPMFAFLWDLLSNETRSSMEQERARIIPNAAYHPGPGMKDLVAGLNQLIQGKLIYDEKAFARIKPYLSGDTVKLLNEPIGSDTARLNRLLLEDAFPLDIQRRPKLLFDPNSSNYIFIDFTGKTVSLLGEDGNKKWMADIGPAIVTWMHRYPNFRVFYIPFSQSNVGLWDVSPRPDHLRVKIMGNVYYKIALDTGTVVAIPVR